MMISWPRLVFVNNKKIIVLQHFIFLYTYIHAPWLIKSEFSEHKKLKIQIKKKKKKVEVYSIKSDGKHINKRVYLLLRK